MNGYYLQQMTVWSEPTNQLLPHDIDQTLEECKLFQVPFPQLIQVVRDML